VHEYKKRTQRYTDTECFLLARLMKERIDLVLPNGDTVNFNKSEDLLTSIRNEFGEELLYIFNHIEPERIIKELVKLKS